MRRERRVMRGWRERKGLEEKGERDLWCSAVSSRAGLQYVRSLDL